LECFTHLRRLVASILSWSTAIVFIDWDFWFRVWRCWHADETEQSVRRRGNQQRRRSSHFISRCASWIKLYRLIGSRGKLRFKYNFIGVVAENHWQMIILLVSTKITMRPKRKVTIKVDSQIIAYLKKRFELTGWTVDEMDDFITLQYYVQRTWGQSRGSRNLHKIKNVQKVEKQNPSVQ